ncbi:hypothetical protein EVAR_76958_1 [Eumeta japonica]|uniref:Uncharacterized protein n=1 Tax=Eumeta variegata TaxID=151549 RepID=A0A4C1SHW9_EUMVA|nr:hypothetical protein EVAR_76958_1 [Eumeta japonica]
MSNQKNGKERNSPFCVMSSLSAATVVMTTTARLCWFYTEHVKVAWTVFVPQNGNAEATVRPARRGHAGSPREYPPNNIIKHSSIDRLIAL